MNVEPIIGEVGRYWVGSETIPGARHLVDILDSQCGCGDYVCRRAALQKETGKQYFCKHLIAARTYAFEDYLEVMRAVALER